MPDYKTVYIETAEKFKMVKYQKGWKFCYVFEGLFNITKHSLKCWVMISIKKDTSNEKND